MLASIKVKTESEAIEKWSNGSKVAQNNETILLLVIKLITVHLYSINTNFEQKVFWINPSHVSQYQNTPEQPILPPLVHTEIESIT